MFQMFQTFQRLCLIAGLAATTFITPANAEMCAIDNVPAATLLLPYFEVDLEDEGGTTTVFSVNNATSEPALAHVTFWTDWAQPTLNFDLFLTGYDVVSVDLRAVFTEGLVPVTADAQGDPDDEISPHGNHPLWDGSFTGHPSCSQFLPYSDATIGSATYDRLVNGHTGRPIASAGGHCAGASLGDGVARGYITIDRTTRCTGDIPSDPGYFGGVNPVASNNNQLWGDFMLLNPDRGQAVGLPLVHIEADPTFDTHSTDSGLTFYGRHTSPVGFDHREPLASTWGVRYLSENANHLDTELLVWRDPSASGPTGAVLKCGQGPGWLPLNETEVIAFDEQEDAVELCFAPDGGVISPPVDPEDPACFPRATQRIPLDSGPAAPPWESGWLLLNLNLTDQVPADVDFGRHGDISQSWVAAVHSAGGLYQVGYSGVALATSCDDINSSVTHLYDIPRRE